MELRSPALPDLPLRGSPMLPRPTLVIGIRHELENPQRAMAPMGRGPRSIAFSCLKKVAEGILVYGTLWLFNIAKNSLKITIFNAMLNYQRVDTTNYFMEVIKQLRTGGQHPVGWGQSV